MGSTMSTVNSSTQPLTTGTCIPGDVFQQWEFVKSASKDPSAATSERQLRKDAQA
ncbi:unnamed protein product, partial [Symbiodinium necroappetens]